MTLTHSPAHTVSVPDIYTDEEADKSYAVFHDTDAEDPRSWLDNEISALWAYNEPALTSSVVGHKPEGNIAIDAFDRFYQHSNADAYTALELTRRWLNIFHPEKEFTVDIATIRGYSQGDWMDVVAAVKDGYGTPAQLADEVRMWAFGDVWTVIPDGGAGISGIYADDAEEALKHFRENFEDQTFDHSIELKVRAENAHEAQSKVEQIVQAIHESDALPCGITATANSVTHRSY